jgi:ferredoxin-NADP reductase/predicted pyridoxine 5'-phosphate oxidase superfamily flavin-nucleotide-binding protein
MGHKYIEIAFTDEVKKVQEEQNSRAGYSRMEAGPDVNHMLSEYEAEFISERDSFYMATVSETDWPYVQHRGGPKGFLRVIDAQTIGFADYAGNRQYVSTGNLRKNDRVSLFMMDYKNQRRLKLLGRVTTIPGDDYERLAQVEVAEFRAPVERGFLIHIEGFDWNCPKYITPRYTDDDVARYVAPLQEENAALKAQIAAGGVSLSAPTETLGEGDLELVITGVKEAAEGVRSYELRAPAGGDLPPVDAGAHLLVPVKLADGTYAERHYSIHSDSAHRDIYEIAVLKQEGGDGGSLAVHEQFQLGMQLRTQHPQNNFQLQEKAHKAGMAAVLIAGGIGITPIKAMATKLAASGQAFDLHYAGKSPAHMAFLRELKVACGDRVNSYISSEGTRLDFVKLIRNASPDSIFYLCGPERMIEGFLNEAERQGLAADRIVFERFSHTVAANAEPVTLHLAQSDKTIEVPADKTLLDAMLENGVDVPHSCKVGDCRTCAVKILDGEADHLDSALTPAERDDGKMMCPCVSRANTPSMILDV